MGMNNHEHSWNRVWRMGWDSNPRDALTPAGFQDQCLQPLGHPSAVEQRDTRPAPAGQATAYTLHTTPLHSGLHTHRAVAD